MRRLLKSFTAFSVIAMLLFSFCISVGAVEETHNSGSQKDPKERSKVGKNGGESE